MKIGINLTSIKSPIWWGRYYRRGSRLSIEKYLFLPSGGKMHYERSLLNVEYILARYDANDSAVLFDEQSR